MRRRGFLLDDSRIQMVVETIDGLPGAPSWEDVIQAVKERCGWAYTRQALRKHHRISAAVELRRSAGHGRVSQAAKPQGQALLVQGRLDRLRAENQRLTAENYGLLAQYGLLLNAMARLGIGEAELKKSLKRIDWK